MDEEVKRLMRMHKLELLGLLQEVTEENDRLRANCRQLEEANAKLALSNHELNMECDALHGELTALRQGGVQEDAGRQPYAPSESAYGLPQPETTEERALPADAHTLPPGNFAEAMVAAEQIAARTQAAADAYLARCQDVYKRQGWCCRRRWLRKVCHCLWSESPGLYHDVCLFHLPGGVGGAVPVPGYQGF